MEGMTKSKEEIIMLVGVLATIGYITVTKKVIDTVEKVIAKKKES